MRVAWLVSVLACVHLVVAQTTDSCQTYYAVAPGQEYLGGTAQTTATDVDLCRAACDAEPNCIGFDFKATTTTCSLTTDITVSNTSNADVTHYTKQQACGYTATSERCFFNYRGQYSNPDQLGPVRGDQGIVDCLQLCVVLSSSCKAIAFNETSNECYFVLSDSTADPAAETGLVYYESDFCSTVPATAQCTNEYFKTADNKVSGGTYISGNDTVDACQVFCNIVIGCVAIDFDNNLNQCYQFTNPTLPLEPNNPGIDHYAQETTCESVESCTYTPFGSNSPPSTAAYTAIEGLVSLDECRAACNDDAGCYGILFNIEYNFDCRHYTEATAFDTTESVPAGFSAYKKKTCLGVTTTAGTAAPGTCSWSYDLTANSKAGGAVQAATGGTADDCKNTCNADAVCTAIDYNNDPAGTQCWVHKKNTYPTTVPSVTGTESHYDRKRICGECTYSYYPEKTRTGGTPQTTLTSEEDCVNGCTTDTSCEAVQYNTAGPVCTFFTTDAVPTADDTNTHYYDRTTCAGRVSGCTENFVKYENSKIPKGTQVTAADVDACKAQCTGGCVGNDFNSLSQCFLNLIFSDIISAGSESVTHYHREPVCNSTDKADCKFFAVGSKVPLTTTGSSSSAVATKSECYIKCIDATECSGMSYDGTTCTLYASASKFDSANLVDGASNVETYRFDAPCGITTGTTATTTPAVTDTTTGGCVPDWAVQADKHVSNGLGQGVLSNEECRAKCIAEADCVAIDYKAGGTPNSCWFHTSPDVINKTTTETGVQFQFLDRCPTTVTTTAQTSTVTTVTPSTCTTEYKKTENLKYSGGQRAESVNTIEACTTECENNPSCTGFDFNEKNECYLLTSKETQSSIPVSPEVVNHYDKQLNCGGCLYKPVPDKNAQNGNPQSFNTQSSCLLACTADTTCVEADYSTTTNGCYFFTAAIPDANLLDLAGNIHWKKLNCTGATTISTTPGVTTTATVTGTGSTVSPVVCTPGFREFKDTQVSGATPVAGQDTPEKCKASCTADATCAEINFNFEGSSCWISTENRPRISPARGNVTHYAKAQLCGDCKYEKRTGQKGVNGAAQSTLTTLDTCLGGCNGDINCRAADFSTSNVCTFYSAVAPNAVVDSNYNYYIKYDCVAQCNRVYTKKANTKVPGGTQRNANTSPLCEEECNKEPACSGADLEEVGKTCWLTLNRPAQAEETPTPPENVTRSVLTGYSCNNCNFDVTSFQKAPSSAQGTTQAAGLDIAGCLAICQNDAGCVGADYNVNTNSCITYNSANANQNLQADGAFTHYTKGSCGGVVTGTTRAGSTTTAAVTTAPGQTTPASGACTPAYASVFGQKRNNGVNIVGISTVAACEAACENRTNCIGFDFDTQNGKNLCWISTDANPAQGPHNAAAENVTSFTRLWNCGSCTFAPFPNRNAAGGVAQSGISTQGACASACAGVTTCRDIDFNSTSSQCFFFTTTVDPSAYNVAAGVIHWKEISCSGQTTGSAGGTTAPGGTTSPPPQACSTTYIKTDNQHKSGGRIYSEGNNNITACAARCSQLATDNVDGGCSGYDWQKNGNVCWILDADKKFVGLTEDTNAEHYELAYRCGSCRFEANVNRTNTSTRTQRNEVGRAACLNACVGTCLSAHVTAGSGVCFHYTTLLTTFSTLSDGSTTYVRLDCGEANDAGDASTTTRATTTRLTTTEAPDTTAAGAEDDSLITISG